MQAWKKTIMLVVLTSTGAAAEPIPEDGHAEATAEWAAFRCGDPAKHHCKDMGDCDEATFHWAICARPQLDRDTDNMPCEQVACPHIFGRGKTGDPK